MEKEGIFRQIKTAHLLLHKKQYKNARQTLGILIAAMLSEDESLRDINATMSKCTGASSNPSEET